MIICQLLHPNATLDDVGFIPHWLDVDDARPARDQLDSNYQHGGGWRPFKGFVMAKDGSIKYPGDDPLAPLACIHLRDELIIIYECGFVAIRQTDRSYEIARMD